MWALNTLETNRADSHPIQVRTRTHVQEQRALKTTIAHLNVFSAVGTSTVDQTEKEIYVGDVFQLSVCLVGLSVCLSVCSNL